MSDYLEKFFNLRGKSAVVIGGGGFLCSEMAFGLAKAGVEVAILDKNEEKLKSVVETIKSFGVKSFGISLDVTRKDELEKAKQDILKRFNKIDILINGAGVNAPTPFLEIKVEEWHAILDSHITATFLSCQVFGEEMVDHQSGSIINMSSASAGPPLSKAFTYSVAKAGIRNLTQNLGREWAKKNVRVNCLRPGFFPTEWSKKHFIDETRNAQILNHTPMGRYGKPQELVGAVLWLCSDAASFVTGAEITIDGGFTAMTI
jgi:NAD(P)-dependent dehydrogenase (short-subunit alcohol dehydrogenase family)